MDGGSELFLAEELAFESLAPQGRRFFWLDLAQWCALHNLFFRSDVFSLEALRGMAEAASVTVSRRQALMLGLRLRKLLDENPEARIIASRCCSCRLLSRARACGFRGPVFEITRAFLDRFADFAIASDGFRLNQDPS